MKYRKKPVVIEAVKWVDGPEMQKYPQWLVRAFGDGTVYFEDGTLIIKTLEGDHKAISGDYIIQGIQGELYPCKPDIFEATYEEVL